MKSEGLPQPQWALINYELNRRYPDADPDQLWNAVCLSWLNALLADLDGRYAVFQSPNFFYLAQRTTREQHYFAQVSEKAHRAIIALYKGIAEKRGHGKHVILLLEPDDYFRYIAHYYPDGSYYSSAGLFICAGYMHIALCESRYGGIDVILCHELTHNLLAHLNLPQWLNEGMAMLAQQRIAGGEVGVHSDQTEKHERFWNSESIQRYWSGQTYFHDAEESALSYHLSTLLCREIFDRYPKEAANFVTHARPEDAGAAAAIEFLRMPLGAIAATVLGAGNWDPVCAIPIAIDSPLWSSQLVLELIRAGRMADAEVVWQTALKTASEPGAKLEVFDVIASMAVYNDFPHFLVTAKRLCEDGLAIDPSYIPLRITQGALSLREKNYCLARSRLLPLVTEARQSFDRAALYYFLALAAHSLGETVEAREFLQKGIEIDPVMSLRLEAEFAIEGPPPPFPAEEEFAEG